MRLRIAVGVRTLLFTVLLIGLAWPLQAQTGRVTGRVVDQATNRPLAGVQVFIPPTGIGNLTDQAGRYLLQNVPVGAVTVTAQLVGYRQGEQQEPDGHRPGGDRGYGCGRGDGAPQAG
jgi:hypothetical protein